MTDEKLRRDIRDRCNAIEEAYEFTLAYAAQGLTTDSGSSTGGQLRDFLQRKATALTGLAEAFAAVVNVEQIEPAAPYHTFLDVLARDARDALAAVNLVLAHPAISSQIIDNLNASIHVRALLTDVFLIDEILKAPRSASSPVSTS